MWYLHDEFRRKLNDALVAYFKVLYSTLASRAESTQKCNIIFDFVKYCYRLRKNIKRNTKRVRYFVD